MASKIGLIFSIILLLISTVSPAPANEYRTTYTINIEDDGTAVWNVEYRTPLVTQEDNDAFENYTEQLESVYLVEFRELMQNSVAAASNATQREMKAAEFTGKAGIQTAPTGNYGVVHYSFTWTKFASLDKDENIKIGDVFVGGLYLSKDNTLIIQYPSGYTAEQITPQPDQIRDGIIWYGLRSFDPGDPTIVLLRPSFSWTQYIILILILGAGAFIIYNVRKNKALVISTQAGEKMGDSGQKPHEIGVEIKNMMDLEDRIVALLKESEGSLFQSDIVKKLDLPKSTVSSALNGLHAKKIILKIRKGRENLIRLALTSDQAKDPS